MKNIKTKQSKDQPAAGKYPTHVPKKTVQPLAATITPITRKMPSRDARPKPPSAHTMTTRSRAKNFQFMNLPPELRCKVYEDVFYCSEDQPLILSHFQLSSLLSWSHTIREEALPVFFAASTFRATFRSNWCVRNQHWHSTEYTRHNETGIVELSPLLRDGDLALPKEAIRFHNINLSVRCVCCVQVLEIGSVQLRVIERKPFISAKITTTNAETKVIWPSFIVEVEAEVEKIGQRGHFNGFTVQDIEKLAMCFRHKADGEHS